MGLLRGAWLRVICMRDSVTMLEMRSNVLQRNKCCCWLLGEACRVQRRVFNPHPIIYQEQLQGCSCTFGKQYWGWLNEQVVACRRRGLTEREVILVVSEQGWQYHGQLLLYSRSPFGAYNSARSGGALLFWPKLRRVLNGCTIGKFAKRGDVTEVH